MKKEASHTLRCDCHCDYIFLTTQLMARPMSRARMGECQLVTSSSQEVRNLILWLVKYGITIVVRRHFPKSHDRGSEHFNPLNLPFHTQNSGMVNTKSACLGYIWLFFPVFFACGLATSLGVNKSCGSVCHRPPR